MATYTKPLKTIVITTLGGNTFTVADTASSSAASDALAMFLHWETMNFPNSGATVYVPFHAVDNISVTTAESDAITKNDPYCEEQEA